MSHTETSALIPHGVVFLYDPTAIIDVPADTGAAPVLATADCISLWTVHDVDAPTTLVLADKFDGDGCSLIFEGSLITKGGKLAFNTSSCEPIIQVQVSAPVAHVAIWANDAECPSRIVCVASQRMS